MTTTTEPKSEQGGASAAWFGVAVAMLLGGLVRGIPLLNADFPLNDGGLFTTMIHDLVNGGFLLPAVTAYNALEIPFAYPPLGFYVAGSVHAVSGIPVIDLLRVLPFLFSLLTIPAMYWLGAGVLGSRTGGVVAALSFALVPRAYLYLVSGGGMTRSPGLLLAVIALALAWRLASNPRPGWRGALLLGLVGALTVLAHFQAALFVAVGALLFAMAASDRRAYLVALVKSGAIGLVLVIPWLIVVVGNHGWDPLLSAAGSGSDPLQGFGNLFSLRFTELFFFDVITLAGAVGLIVALIRREALLPIWLVATLLVDGRAGSTFSMVPLSLLAGYGLAALAPAPLREVGLQPWRFMRQHPWSSAGIAAVVVTLFLASYVSAIRPLSPMHALNEEQRAGMEWVGTHLPSDAVLAAVTDSEWAKDAVSEWLPTLAIRRSAATVQGYEWLGAERYAAQQAAYRSLQRCARDVLPCVIAWADATHVAITHVYLPKGRLHGPYSDRDCCPAPRNSVELVPGARVVYDGPGATVIELP